MLRPKQLFHVEGEQSAFRKTNRFFGFENSPVILVAPARAAICSPANLIGIDSVDGSSDGKIFLRHIGRRRLESDFVRFTWIGFCRGVNVELSQNEVPVPAPTGSIHRQVRIAKNFQTEAGEFVIFVRTLIVYPETGGLEAVARSEPSFNFVNLVPTAP